MIAIRSLLVSVCFLATAVAVPAASPRTATYTCSVTSVATDRKGKEKAQPPIVALTRVHGDSARAEFTQTSGDFHAGDYLLTVDGARTIYSVRAAKREYSIIRPAELGPMLAKAMQHGLVKVKAERADAAFGRVPGEERLDGAAVEHTRVTREFTIAAKVVLVTKHIATHETLDMWTAPALPPLPNPLGDLFVAILQSPSFVDPGLARKAAAFRDSVGTAPPLRVVHRLTTGDPGKETSTVTTIETRGLTLEGTLPPTRFAVPPGFREVDK